MRVDIDITMNNAIDSGDDALLVLSKMSRFVKVSYLKNYISHTQCFYLIFGNV